MFVQTNDTEPSNLWDIGKDAKVWLLLDMKRDKNLCSYILHIITVLSMKSKYLPFGKQMHFSKKTKKIVKIPLQPTLKVAPMVHKINHQNAVQFSRSPFQCSLPYPFLRHTPLSFSKTGESQTAAAVVRQNFVL